MKSLTLILGIFCLIAAVSSQACPEGQVYSNGRTSCNNPCRNRCGNRKCTDDCRSGCYCPEGQKFDSISSSCVPQEECPTETATPETESSCDEGLVYLDGSSGICKNPCSDSCASATGETACTDHCEAGCYCPEGTVRSESGCVSPDQCPSSEPESTSEPQSTPEPQSICDEGLVYLDGATNVCKNPCSDSCAFARGNRVCTANCESGCYCPEGTVRSGSECVSPDQCPSWEPESTSEPQSTPQPQSSCDGGLVYSDGSERCTNPCVDSCEAFRGERGCTRECRTGCYCPEGRKFDSRSSSCVSEQQCPIPASETA